MEIQFFFKFLIFILFDFISYSAYHGWNLQGYWYSSEHLCEESITYPIDPTTIGIFRAWLALATSIVLNEGPPGIARWWAWAFWSRWNREHVASHAPDKKDVMVRKLFFAFRMQHLLVAACLFSYCYLDSFYLTSRDFILHILWAIPIWILPQTSFGSCCT